MWLMALPVSHVLLLHAMYVRGSLLAVGYMLLAGSNQGGAD